MTNYVNHVARFCIAPRGVSKVNFSSNYFPNKFVRALFDIKKNNSTMIVLFISLISAYSSNEKYLSCNQFGLHMVEICKNLCKYSFKKTIFDIIL